MGPGPLIRLDRVYPSNTAYLFPLTRRGLFSELHVLVNALAFSLLRGAHLLVDTSKMRLDWDGLFDTRFAPYDDDAPDVDYPVSEVISIKRDRRALFDVMRGQFLRQIAEAQTVRAPQVGFEGTVEALNAALAQRVFRPSPAVTALAAQIRQSLGLGAGPFVALQVRGGDKTAGVVKGNGARNIEGEAVDGEVYSREIRRAGLEAQPVLVITDDYAAFEALAAANPDMRWVTNCPPAMSGYFHEDFQRQDPAERTAAAARMIAEVALAAEATLFLGPYRSNLSSFTHLLRYPRPTLSVDSQRQWAPL